MDYVAERTRLLKELASLEKANNAPYRIRHPEDVLPLLDKYRRKSAEHFVVVLLNGAHEVIATKVVTKGLVNRTLVHPVRYFVKRSDETR